MNALEGKYFQMYEATSQFSGFITKSIVLEKSAYVAHC